MSDQVKRMFPSILLTLVVGGSLFFAGKNLALNNIKVAQGDDVGVSDHAIYEGGPITVSFIALIAQLIYQWFTQKKLPDADQATQLLAGISDILKIALDPKNPRPDWAPKIADLFKELLSDLIKKRPVGSDLTHAEIEDMVTKKVALLQVPPA